MKKIYLFFLKILNFKTLAIIRTLISYNKTAASQLLINDDLEIYNEHKNYFSQLILADKNKTIMDFGCGTGRYLDIFKNFQLVYLVDISRHNLKLAEEKAQTLEINYVVKRQSLNKLNEKVDYFFSSGVFGQFYQFDHKVVKKITSIIKKDGKAIFTVKVKDNSNDEVLAVPEDKIFNSLEGKKYNIHKKHFSGINNQKDYFFVIELYG